MVSIYLFCLQKYLLWITLCFVVNRKRLHDANIFVFVLVISGESVEENANVVVKLLIRRPECFGPALRGEGGQGLLAAMKEAIKISEDPTLDLPNLPEGVAPT